MCEYGTKGRLDDPLNFPREISGSDMQRGVAFEECCGNQEREEGKQETRGIVVCQTSVSHAGGVESTLKKKKRTATPVELRVTMSLVLS